MNYAQRPAARLAWALRQRTHVALSLRTACALTGLDETRTLTLLDCLALCLPIQRQRTGWLVAEITPPWAAPRNAAQRAAVVAWTLYTESLTVQQVAALTGLARNSAYVLLVHLSEVLPIRDDDTLWRMDVRQGMLWHNAK